MGESRGLVSNTLILLLKQLLTVAMAGVLVILAPRYLGDTGLGQITFANSFTAIFVPFILLGVPSFVVKEVARDRSKLSSLFVNSLAMRLPLSIVVFLAVFLVASIAGYADETKLVIMVACSTTVVSCLADTVGAILQGLEDMSWVAIAEVSGKVVLTATAIFVLVGGWGVIAYSIVTLLGTSVYLVLMIAHLFRNFPINLELDFGVWRSLLAGGAPFLLNSILMTSYQRIDATILRFVTTEAVVGWYGAAMQLNNIIVLVPSVIITAAFPALARLHVSDPGKLFVSVSRCVRYITISTMPLAVGMILTSSYLIDFLGYPAEFSHSEPLLAILAVQLPFTGILMIMGTVLAAVDRQKSWAVVLAISLVLNIVLNVVLIPIAQSVYGNGAIGAASTSVITETVSLVLGIRLLPKGILDRSMVMMFAKTCLGSAVMALPVWFTLRLGFVPSVVVGVVVYLVCCFLLRLIEPIEIEHVWNIVTKRTSGKAQDYGV